MLPPQCQGARGVCTLAVMDIAFVRGIARGAAPTLAPMVLLKSFKRLGYMPRASNAH